MSHITNMKGAIKQYKAKLRRKKLMISHTIFYENNENKEREVREQEKEEREIERERMRER